MEKIKKRIANLKVAGKLKVYRMTVLVMTLFLVLVALISTLVIRSNIEKITEVWSPSLEYLQDLETMTAKYRIKQYQHLVESDASDMTACEEEIRKLESQIQDTDANLDAIMSADSDAKKGQNDYEVANAAWEKYRAASDEILKLSRENKQQEAAKLMTGEVYEEYKAFTEKLTILRDEFQVELDQAKTMANVCTIIIFVVIVAAGLAIAVVTTLIGRIITNSITEPVEQIDAAVASLRKGELSNVEMLTYESDDELGDTIKNLKEAMGILADYVSEISMEVKAIAQGDLTRNGDDITDFLGDFSELKVSLLYILKRFNSTLTEISNLAEQVSSNASEVENASKSLADGATEQAGVIEELNATIDTVVDLAADTAKETQSASARVKASADKANEEKEKMNDLLMEMEHITEISKEIGNIITISGQVTLRYCLYLHRDLADIICQNTHSFFQIPDGIAKLILRLIGKHFYIRQFALTQAGNCCIYLFYRLGNGIGNDPSDHCRHYSYRKTRCHDHNKYDYSAYISHGLCPV